MKKYHQKVDTRSRKAMVDFLSNHFRYSTMNSWNKSTSYACNIKIYNLGLPRETENKLYNLIESEEYWDGVRELFDEFATQYNYNWQIGSNGRNSGYIVLYEGYNKPSEHKSYCTKCGQRNYSSIKDTGNICGRCRQAARIDYINPPKQIGTYPGRSVDMHEDYEDFSMFELKERVSLVQAFDKVADNLIAYALQTLEDYTVEDEVYYTPHTKKVLVAI